MKILSTEDIYTWEQATMEHQKLASTALMERAAEALFQAISQYIGEKKCAFVILCGFGNNGGDGLAVGRLLHQAGHTVNMYLIEHERYSEENQINQKRLQDFQIPIYPLSPLTELNLPTQHIIIDALFGYGLSRALDQNWATLVNQINCTPNTVLSVDIPSGLFAGKPTPKRSPIIEADMTYTFACPKLSLLLPDYAKFTGDFRILDIGLDKDIYHTFTTDYHLTQKEKIQKKTHPLSKFSHKGSYGHAYIAGGSYGSIGAVLLASKAALKTGCGRVTTYIPSCGYTALQSAFPEAQVQTDPLHTHISMFPDDIMHYSAIGLGMGLGRHPDSEQTLHQLFERFISSPETPPLVLDADAINILSKHPEWHTSIPSDSILTPHPKELERLLGSWENDFEKLKKVQKWCIEHQQIIVIKGAHSAIVLPTGQVHFNSTGNPGMATGGSGDVLSGILTSLLAQGYSSTDAAIIGVYLHGLAGDVAAQTMHQKSMIASDIIEHISGAWQLLQNH